MAKIAQDPSHESQQCILYMFHHHYMPCTSTTFSHTDTNGNRNILMLLQLSNYYVHSQPSIIELDSSAIKNYLCIHPGFNSPSLNSNVLLFVAQRQP